jgi:hypothetical protein
MGRGTRTQGDGIERRAYGRRRVVRFLAVLAGAAGVGACAPGDVTQSGNVYRVRTRSLRNQRGGSHR